MSSLSLRRLFGRLPAESHIPQTHHVKTTVCPTRRLPLFCSLTDIRLLSHSFGCKNIFFFFLNPPNWSFNLQMSLNCYHGSCDWSTGSLVRKDWRKSFSEQILDQNKSWNDVPSFSFTSRLIHDYLSMAPFADYLDSMYFNRFLQWKWLERWSLSHDTLHHNKTAAISTSSTFQREPDESRLLLITVNSQDHTKPPGGSGKQDTPLLLGFIASSLLYSWKIEY